MAPSVLKADWRNTNKSGRPVSTVVFLSITAGRTGGSSGWRNVDPPLHRQRKASLQAAAKRDRAAPSPAPRDAVLVGVTIEAFFFTGAAPAEIYNTRLVGSVGCVLEQVHSL